MGKPGAGRWRCVAGRPTPSMRMRDFADIKPPIIEALYTEGLDLADAVRAAFDMSGRIDQLVADEDLARIALSCEALRCTTRMMHALAWLLNQRAYFRGELSEFQLRRYGRLPASQAPGDPQQLAMLGQDLRDLSAATEEFYARIARLDQAFRQHFTMEPPAIERLRARLERSINSL